MENIISRRLLPLPQEILDRIADATEYEPLHHPSRAVTCCKQIRRLTTLLGQESALLHKLRYKQKNQHAAATWWRHVSGSQRVARRVLGELNESLLPYLPPPEAKEPALPVSSLLLAIQASLRLVMLLDQTVSFHIKSSAATQQLLRAALFMPMALTVKALVARLHSIWINLLEEMNVLLSLLTTSQATIVQQYSENLPPALRGLLSSKVSLKERKASHKRPRKDRKETEQPLSAARTSNRSLDAPSATVLGRQPSVSQTVAMVDPASAIEMLDSALHVSPELLTNPVEKSQTKKRKKRKQDDIDAIFAGR